MARFTVGERVRIPINNQTAPSIWRGREGVVTSVPPPIGSQSLVEQQYMVRLDGADSDEPMFEGQIEEA